MSKENNSTNQKDNHLLDVAEALDQNCSRILRILLEDRTMQFSTLQNSIAKLYDFKMTNKELSKHLKHLIAKELVKCSQITPKKKTYCLSDKFRTVTQLPIEEIKQYIELQKDPNLPIELRALNITKEQLYSSLSEEGADKEADRDLHDIMSLNLWEAKLSIENDLSLKKGESDVSFWDYFVKPIYRIHIEKASEKCRYNDEYKKRLFEKIDLLIEQLRSDRELYKKRRDTGKRVRA